MNVASKKFPYLSVTKAQDRLEVIEWMCDNLDYTEEECGRLSLKEMQAIRERVESEER